MTGRLVRAVPVSTADESVTAFLADLRAALNGTGPALAPHPADRGPAVSAGAGQPLHDDEDTAADPTAVVVATSGSTGSPRSAVLPASALLASASATHDRLGGPGAWLLALPPSTIAGVQVCVRCLTGFTTPVVCDLRGGFDPAVFAATARLLRGPRRYTSLVPTQVDRLLRAGGEPVSALAEMDAVLVGGGPLPRDLAGRAAAAGVRLVSTYGSSETSGGCVYDGVPLDGVTVDLDPHDRVRIAGAVVARGYRGAPGHPAFVASAAGRRFTTDDLGELRARSDGGPPLLTVLGRIDDVVVTGGYKVSPAVVADSLRARPGVADAAVVGVPDPRWGARLLAAVVPDPGSAQPLDPADLHRAVAADLGRWAAPAVHVLAELPLIGPGKVDRTALQAELLDRDQGGAPPA